MKQKFTDFGRVILAENIVEKLNEVIESVNKLETMNEALKEAIIALATEPRPTANLLKQLLNKLTKEAR